MSASSDPTPRAIRHLHRLTALSLTTILTGLFAAQGANWPHWRGPAYNGSTPETGLPATWTKTENVAWSADLPGPSAATPIVWGDRVFISSVDTGQDSLNALALDLTSGKILWNRKVAQGASRDRRSTFAAPSPVTDGELVAFYYGNGHLAAFDFAGRKLWRRNLCEDYGEFAFMWTYSASPLLYKGKLYIQVLQRDVPTRGRGARNAPGAIESYLLALHPESGETIWKEARPSLAVAESREAFTSPIPTVFDGRSEILVIGGDCLTGHDPATGLEQWRWGTWNPNRIGHWRLVPSPVAGGGVILACGPKRAPIFAIQAGGAGRLTDSSIRWDSRGQREITADVPTPLFYRGDFFVLSDVEKSLSRVNPATGEVKWTVETPGRSKYESSPTGADGRIFLMSFNGDVVVVDAERGEILHQVSMGEERDDLTRSTIAVADKAIFIRTNSKLYCIRRKG